MIKLFYTSPILILILFSSSCQIQNRYALLVDSHLKDTIHFHPEQYGDEYDSIKHGVFKKYHPRGALMLKAYYKNGLRHGESFQYSVRGELIVHKNHKIIMVNDTAQSVKHGKAITYAPNGKIVSTGEYVNDTKEGYWKYYHRGTENLKSEVIYKKGERHGPFVSYYNDGSLLSRGTVYDEIEVNGEIQTDVYHGKLERFYKDGNPKEIATYDMGKLQGEHISYSSNGRKTRKMFKNGLQTGKQETWNEDGNKMFETHYQIIRKEDKDTSVKHGPEYKWENNTLARETNYEYGLEHGTRIRYYPSGELYKKQEIRENKPQGDLFEFYKNGNIKSYKNLRSFVDEKGNEKTVSVGLSYGLDEEGNYDYKNFNDSLGETVTSYNFRDGMIERFEVDRLITVNYSPNGNVLSVRLLTFGLYYYLNGNLRKLYFEIPEKRTTNYAAFTDDGRFLSAYSDKRNNSDSLIASQEKIELLAQITGKKHIPNDFYTDSVKEGTYRLKLNNGQPLAIMEFENDLPHGEFVFFDPLNNDTLWYSRYEKGKQTGYYVRKFGGRTVLRRGENRPDGSSWRKTYRSDGTPNRKDVFNKDGERILQDRYYQNGQLDYSRNKEYKTFVGYTRDGYLRSKTELIDTSRRARVSFRYYPGSEQIRRIRFFTDNVQDSIELRYYENGQLQYRVEYQNSKRHGEYRQYDKTGNLLNKGQYENDKKEGIWVNYEQDQPDTAIFRDGDRIAQLPERACACIDTSFSRERRMGPGSVSLQIEYPYFMKHVPPYIKPVDSFNYRSIFYLGMRRRSGGTYVSMSPNMLFYKEFAFNVPANEQLKVTLNPCLTEGYISEMRANVAFIPNNPEKTRTLINPGRISLELIKGPLVSADINYKNFTAFYDATRISLEHDEMDVTFDEEPDACYVKGSIKDLLDIEVINAIPIISTRLNRGQNLTGFGLTLSERLSFFGFRIEEALLHFQYRARNQTIPIMGISDKMLAGNGFVTGTIQIPAVQTGVDNYRLKSPDEAVTNQSRYLYEEAESLNKKIDEEAPVIAFQELKAFLVRRGFTDVIIRYQEESEMLKVQFYAE